MPTPSGNHAITTNAAQILTKVLAGEIITDEGEIDEVWSDV